MIDVTVEIAGLATLSIHPRAGALASLVRPERVTAARMDPQKAICSDQTVTFEVAATPEVRSSLLKVGRVVGRLIRPVGFNDTTLRVQRLPTLPETCWLGSEKIRVRTQTGRTITVERAIEGTARIQSTMPVDQAMLREGMPLGRHLHADAPVSLAGVRAVYRLHHDDGTTETLFRGVVSDVLDSGDMLQLTLKSDIERVGAQEIPEIRMLYPFADTQYQKIGGYDSPSDGLRAQLTTSAAKWGWDSGSISARDVTYWRFVGIKVNSPFIASAGVPVRSGTHRVLPYRDRDVLGQTQQPYIATPIHPLDLSTVRAVAILGADGADAAWTDANKESKALSADWYMLTEVERDDTTDFDPLGSSLFRLAGTGLDFFGPLGVEVGKDWAEPWVLRHAKNGVPQNGMDAPPYFPTTIAPSRVVVLPVGDSFDQFRYQRLAGFIPADLFETPLPVTAIANVFTTLRRWDTDSPPTSSLAEYGTMEQLRGPSPARYVWPLEQWSGRLVKDTYFGDMRAALAIVFAPGPNGVVRPVYLTRDLKAATSHVINEDNIRDRDHTINLTPDLTIERVELQDLPHVQTVPRALWNDPDTPIIQPSPRSYTIVSSYATDEGYEGSRISIKRTPILNRPPAFALSTGTNGRTSVAGGMVAVARACWTRVVENYGKPLPRVTLVVDRRMFRGFPGDLVDISLSNMPSPSGGIGVTNLRGQVWERGDDIERGTCEVEILLVGWLDYED